MASKIEPREEVRAGAAWLDEHKPGWHDVVDTYDLRMANCSNCVLGQLFGNYNSAMRQLRLDEKQAKDLGFNGGGGVFRAVDYHILAAEWCVAIKERRDKSIEARLLLAQTSETTE